MEDFEKWRTERPNRKKAQEIAIQLRGLWDTKSDKPFGVPMWKLEAIVELTLEILAHRGKGKVGAEG